jgi:hypothetical protein
MLNRLRNDYAKGGKGAVLKMPPLRPEMDGGRLLAVALVHQDGSPPETFLSPKRHKVHL